MTRLLIITLLCLGACQSDNMLVSSHQNIRLGNNPAERLFSVDLIVPAHTTIEIPWLSFKLSSFGTLQMAVTSDWPEEIILFGDSGDQSLNVRVKKIFAFDTFTWRNPLYLKNDYSAPVKVSVKISGSGAH